MRIAINTRFLLPGKLEGLGWYTHEMVKRMVAIHPDDEFFFLFDRPYDKDFIYAPNVTPVVLYPPARHPLLWYAWFEWAVPGALRRIKPDVFFSPDAYLSLRTKVPTLMTVHDVLPLEHPEQIPWAPRFYYRHFLPRFLQRADQIITISEHVKSGILNVSGLPQEKVRVVYNGCREGFVSLPESEQKLVRQQYTEGKPYFFYTGAIHPRKNIDRLIRAFDQFKIDTGAPALLLLAGRKAWQTSAVDQAYAAAAFQKDIRFLGYVAEEELTRLMASAIALTYVSLAEGFGLPVLEAMNCQTPVLCSNTTSLPEVAGEAALLVDPESEDAIVSGLKKIYSDKDFRLSLIPEMKKQTQLFSWDVAAEQVYASLKDLSGNSQAW